MAGHTFYMERCLALAERGAGLVAPNPMVGCVIVHCGKIIGEGFHHEFGGPHAEVNAVRSVRDPRLLRESTLYVSLEPCAHMGKTPPCSELIIRERIPRVVIGMRDPFPEVAGKGEQQLKKAGVEIITGIMEKECRELNRRFLTFQEKKRPYVILKWAQTSDGFIDSRSGGEDSGKPVWISSPLARRLVHRCRSLEGAILVGTATAMMDNPSLTVRDWSGDNPLRLVIDRKARLPRSLHLFDDQAETVIFTGQAAASEGKFRFEPMDFASGLPSRILGYLYSRHIQSLIVEGGSATLTGFLESNLWDEAHIYTAPLFFGKGVKAPVARGRLVAEEDLDGTHLAVLRNEAASSQHEMG